MIAPAYPLVNGNRYDWSSVHISFNGIPYTGVKSIRYKQALTPGIVRGTRAQPTGRTRGQYEPDGSMELYKEDYQLLIRALSANGARGYMEAAFQILVQYSSDALGVITDTLAGVRIASDEDSPNESPDAMVTSCDLSVMYILRDGLPAMAPEQLLR